MAAVLFFDTETTGKLIRRADHTHPGQPDPVQIAAKLIDSETLKPISKISFVVRPTIPIPDEAAAIHGITNEFAERYGVSRRAALSAFHALAVRADLFVAHNISFDLTIMRSAYFREGVDAPSFENVFCTMLASTDLCRLPSEWKSGGYKWPKLIEAYQILVDPAGFDGAHDAEVDVDACIKLWERLR